MFKNLNRCVIIFGLIVLVGSVFYLNHQKNINKISAGYSWYNDDLGYRLLLPVGWRAEKDLTSVDGSVIFLPNQDSPYLSMLQMSTTFLEIHKDSRSRELLQQVNEESHTKNYPDSIKIESTIADKPAVCYIYQFVPKRLSCFIFVNDTDTFDISSDFLVIPEVQKMWASLEF